MKKLCFPLILLAAIAGLSTIGGCTKTNTKTVNDTTIVRDTTVITDSIHSPWYSIAQHINDSLWAYYPLNGNLGDSSGNNHALTLYNGVVLGTDFFGKAQDALDFPGGTGRAVIQDGENFNAPDFTVSLFAEYRASTVGFLFNKINYNDATGWSFSIGTDPVDIPDTIRFAVTDLSASTICSTSAPTGASPIMVDSSHTGVQTYSWYHVVVTFANGAEKMYLNGKLVSSGFLPNTPQIPVCSGAPFVLGNWWSEDNGPAFTGKLDEIRIYSKALSDSSVTYLFNTFQRH